MGEISFLHLQVHPLGNRRMTFMSHQTRKPSNLRFMAPINILCLLVNVQINNHRTKELQDLAVKYSLKLPSCPSVAQHGFLQPGLENPSSQGLLSGPLLIYKPPMSCGEVTKGHLSKEFLFIFLLLYP